eukprot:scaffold515279_cov34-Prasinocladus_malaysianus.AAC.1
MDLPPGEPALGALQMGPVARRKAQQAARKSLESERVSRRGTYSEPATTSSAQDPSHLGHSQRLTFSRASTASVRRSMDCHPKQAVVINPNQPRQPSPTSPRAYPAEPPPEPSTSKPSFLPRSPLKIESGPLDDRLQQSLAAVSVDSKV